MTRCIDIPTNSYGVLMQNSCDSVLDEAAEQIRTLGYAVIESEYNEPELRNISDEFDRMRQRYIETYGEATLKVIDEYNTIRAPLTHGGEIFLKLALNKNLLEILRKLIPGKFILNQQNGVINPPRGPYSQGAWHRDLPYQHFVSTKPLAINALFCIDDFTFENGGTFVLPASQKTEAFPSSNFVKRNAVQIEAKAGSFILLDCMLFHSGGRNNTDFERRGVNHIYNIPYFKQQINIPMNVDDYGLSADAKDILGYNYMEPLSVAAYFSARTGDEP